MIIHGFNGKQNSKIVFFFGKRESRMRNALVQNLYQNTLCSRDRCRRVQTLVKKKLTKF